MAADSTNGIPDGLKGDAILSSQNRKYFEQFGLSETGDGEKPKRHENPYPCNQTLLSTVLQWTRRDKPIGKQRFHSVTNVSKQGSCLSKYPLL